MTTKRIIYFFLLFAISSAVFAANEKSNSIAPSTNRLAEIQQKHKEAETAYDAASTIEESKKIMDLFNKKNKKQ